MTDAVQERTTMPEWSGEAFAEFLKRCNQVEVSFEYLKNHASELGLVDTVSCISVGPGNIYIYILIKNIHNMWSALIVYIQHKHWADHVYTYKIQD